MSFRTICSLSFLLVCACSMPAPFRVMSFNIRYGTADDKEDRWELRRPLAIDTIRANDPDLLGLQEVLASQADELKQALPEYGFIGVGRDDGDRKGEFVPIFFRTKRFTLVSGGHFWLSDKPDTPGSVGWDAALTRMATWAKLRCNEAPVNEIYVINTHFDHRGQKARTESAKLIRRATDAQAGTPIIVLGDFNSAPSEPPYAALTRDQKNLAELRDAYTAVGQSESDAATYHAFRGGRDGPRIDWILFNRRFEPLEAGIDRRDFAGRFPSDHFPVTAMLRLLPETAWGGM